MRKRVLAAVLTLAMMFSLSVSASAANTTVRTEDVKCKYESGVLRVTVPKKDAKAIEAPSRIMIE